MPNNEPTKLLPEAELAILRYLRGWAVGAFLAVSAVSGLIGWAILSSSHEVAIEAVNTKLKEAEAQIAGFEEARTKALHTLDRIDFESSQVLTKSQDLDAKIDELANLTARERETVTGQVKEIKDRYQEFQRGLGDSEQLAAAIKEMGSNYDKIAAAVAGDSRFVSRLIPVGIIVAFCGPATNVPKGWVLCDGAVLKITDFPDLYAAIGTSWGGDASTFNLPDLRGRFLRGVDGGTNRDPDASSRTAIAVGGNTGSAVGSLETDAFQGHVHKSNAETFSTSYVPLTRISTGGNQGGAVTPNTGGPLFDGANGVPRTSSETRPLNVYVNYIIKTTGERRSSGS